MSKRTHNKLQDTIVDISEMKMALASFETLEEELYDVEETEKEMHSVLKHALALEEILKGANKQISTFSTVTAEELRRAGVQEKHLILMPAKVAQLVDGQTANVQAEIADLHLRIKKIYKHVNMDHARGSRMIIDAVLLTLAEISSSETTGIAILPEMKIDKIQISHPVSGFELWLKGDVDYAVIEYRDVVNYKERLIEPGSSRRGAFDISQGRLLLVEAKRQECFRSYIPEAVAQAITILKSTKEKLPEVRFCLSDGQIWIFFTVKSENGMLTYCESTPRYLLREELGKPDSLFKLREIVQLTCEWLRPTMSDLFILE